MGTMNVGSMVNNINSSYDNYATKSKSVFGGNIKVPQSSDVNLHERLTKENRAAADSASNMTDDDIMALSGMASDKIKMNIGMAMLAQANKLPSDIINLIK